MLTDLMEELAGDDGRAGGAQLRQVGFLFKPYSMTCIQELKGALPSDATTNMHYGEQSRGGQGDIQFTFFFHGWGEDLSYVCVCGGVR
jgi:hypothetical protein